MNNIFENFIWSVWKRTMEDLRLKKEYEQPTKPEIKELQNVCNPPLAYCKNHPNINELFTQVAENQRQSKEAFQHLLKEVEIMKKRIDKLEGKK